MYLLPAIALFLATGCIAAKDVDCSKIKIGSCKQASKTACSESCGAGWQTIAYDCQGGIHGKGKYTCTSPCNEQDCDNSCKSLRKNKNCFRITFGTCSRTCGVASYTSRYMCNGKTHTCEEACCCGVCGTTAPGGGSSGGPGKPAILCKDASDIPALDKLVVCPPIKMPMMP
ncbi:hypothetical protein LSH36_22g10049 [Paralvinella palmiformis]|uniref:Uncharacterized protein n=1 Tax=Paralvinella palmiformis TaxID=53620 RepID=A0AAD9NGQ0_9ANNE|nr:hypothetical protein LSH36_22g10049 [Paralvinella palmiformis]